MNTTPPAPPRRSITRIVAKVVAITLAVFLIAIGGCFVVMWASAS